MSKEKARKLEKISFVIVFGCFVCWQLQCFDLYTCNKRTYFDQTVPKPKNCGYEHLRSWHDESLLGEMEAGGGGGGGNLTISCPLSAGRCYFPSTVVGWIMYWYLKKKLFINQLWFLKCWCWHLRDFTHQVVADVTWAELEHSWEYSWVNWFLTILDIWNSYICTAVKKWI